MSLFPFTQNPELQPLIGGDFGPVEDITLDVHPDGDSGGDCDIAEAFDFIRQRSRAQMAGPGIVGLYGGGARTPTINVVLRAGTHTLPSNQNRLENVITRVHLYGPDIASNFDDPTAIVKCTGSQKIIFNHCWKIDVTNIDFQCGVRANRFSGIHINGGSGVTSGYSGFHCKMHELEIWYMSIASSMNWLTTAYLHLTNTGSGRATNLRFSTGLTGYSNPVGTPAISIQEGANFRTTDAMDFSAYTGGSSLVVPMIRVQHGSRAIFGGNVDIPSDRGGTRILVDSGALCVFEGDLDLNSAAAPGTAPASTINANGSFFNVVGTYTA